MYDTRTRYAVCGQYVHVHSRFRTSALLLLLLLLLILLLFYYHYYYSVIIKSCPASAKPPDATD